MPKIGTIFVLHIARVAEMADLQKQRGRVQRGGLLALAQHGGEIIDPRVGRRTLDGHGLHVVDGVRNAFVILELCEFLLRQRRRAAELEIGLAIDVRRLNVADSVSVAAVENDAVAGNLLVLLEVEHIADMQALGWHFDHVSAGELLHQLVVRFLRWWGAQNENGVRLGALDVIDEFARRRDGEDKDERKPGGPRIVHRDCLKALCVSVLFVLSKPGEWQSKGSSSSWVD